MFSSKDFQPDGKKGSTRFFPTTYLDSPILTTPYDGFVQTRNEFLAQDPKNWDRSASTIFQKKVSEYQVLLGADPHVPALLVPQQYPDVFFYACAPMSVCQEEMDLMQAAADPIAKASNDAYARMTGLDGCHSLPDGMSFFQPYVREYSQMRFFEEFVMKYHGERAQGGRKGRPVQEVTAWGIKVVTDGSLWYFSRLLGVVGPIMTTHEQLLMLKDALYARFNVLVAHEAIYKETDFKYLVRQVWDWQEECLSRYGNEGYELAKSIESLSKTYMSRVAGCDLPCDTDSFTDMVRKVSDKEMSEINRRNALRPGSVSEEPIMAKKFALLIALHHEFFEIVEIFGLQKCSGHPLIDPERGGVSAAKEAKEPDETLYEDAKALRNSWVRIFIESFVKKHGRYPEFTKPPEESTELRRLWKLNQLNIHRTSYPLSDLNNIILAQHFTFDYYEDYLQLLDDKAISFKRTERHLFWDKQTNEKATTSVRLILEMMARPEISPHKIIEAIEEGKVPLDWLIVSITPKEREFKLNPRMFAMFVLEMRHFFAMHEANLAVTILPYIPQLTMTDSRQDIQERFLNLTRVPEIDDRQTLLLEFDLSRWNLRWRKLCINSIGSDLNDLFGMKNTFTAGHSFFTDALISVRVPGLKPPDARNPFPEDSLLEWNNHLGGFEGILQKLWSIATVAMMDKGLADLPLAYTWTIQGDNVTAVVTLPPPNDGVSREENLLHWKKVILERAEKTTSSVNQDLKAEECVASTRVLTYSKDIYSNAVEFFTTLKFFSRIFPSTADDFPGVATQLSAIYSGCVAASERTKNSPIGFFLALGHGALYLSRLLRYDICYTAGFTTEQKKILVDPCFIRYALLLPAELGGLATLSMADFMYKGGSDPLAKALVTVYLTKNTLRASRRIYQESFSPLQYNSKLGIQALIKDPKGLPTRKPVAPVDSVAEGARAVLRSVSKNPHIKDVMSVEIEKWDEQLCEHFSRIEPLAVDLLHDLRASSVAGRAETLSRTFTATRSLQALARDNSETDLIMKVIAQARKQVVHMLARFKTKTPPSMVASDMSLFKWVSGLRDLTWGKMGFRPAGVDSHLPFDFPLVFGYEKQQSEISLMAQYPQGVNTSYVRGPFPPMKGSRTREAKSSRGYTVVAINSSASAVKDQQRIKAFAQGNPAMERLIDVIALTRTDVDLAALSPLMLQKDGGNNVHRYRSLKGDDSAYVLGQGNNCTYTTVNTDHVDGLSASTKDYAIMVQEQVVFLQAIASLRRIESGHSTEYDRISMRFSAEHLTELPDDTLVLEGDMSLRPVSLYNNPLVYVPEILVKKISGPMLTPEFSLSACDRTDISLSLAALKSACHRMLGQISELTGAGGVVIRRSEHILDILELRTLGLRNVLNVFSFVLAERIVLTVAQGWTSKRLKAAACLICLKQGPTLISSIARYIRHPSLSSDPLVQTLGICPGPTYQGRRVDESRMLAFITRKTISLLTDQHSQLYDRSSILFLSDNLECVSRELELMAYLTVMVSNLEGELPDYEVEGTLKGLRTNMANFSHTDERIKQSRLYTLFLLWADGLEAEYPVCSSRFMQLAKSPRIELAPLTVVRALRTARLLPPEPGSKLSIAVERITPPRMADLYSPSHTGETGARARGEGISSWVSSEWGSPSERVRKDFAYNRGRHTAYGSSALDAWWSAKGLFFNQHIYIVGSGQGAAALTALAGGALSVCGLDLRRDLPKEESLTEDYVPPLVMQFGDDSKYVQAIESFTTSGDWFSRRTYQSFIQTIPSFGTVVIDIQGVEGYSPASLRPLMAMGWQGSYILRWQGGVKALPSVVGTLLSVTEDLSVYRLRSFSSHIDVLLRGYLVRHKTLIPNIVTGVYPIVLSLPLPPILYDREWAFDILFAPIGGPPSYNLTTACNIALSIINDLAGEYTTRPNYSSWTRILHIGVACTWLLLPPDRHVESLSTLANKRTVSLRLSDHTLSVTVTHNLLRTLTHLAARIMEPSLTNT